jgi:hypothetical protein
VSSGATPLSLPQREAYAAAVATQCAHWQKTCAAAAAARRETNRYASGASSIPQHHRSSLLGQPQSSGAESHGADGEKVEDLDIKEGMQVGPNVEFEAFCDEGLKRAASLALFQRAVRTIIFRCGLTSTSARILAEWDCTAKSGRSRHESMPFSGLQQIDCEVGCRLVVLH